MPVSDNTQLHTMPAATRGMTCGRKRTVRAKVPSDPAATLRITDATTRPSVTGMKLKKMISRKALKIVPSRFGSVRTAW